MLWLERELHNIATRLDRIDRTLRLLLKQGEQEMANLDAITAAVSAQSSVEDSVVTLLQNLAKAVADLKTQVDDPAAQAAIDALTAQIQQNTTRLSDAVTANTPAG